ncbi:39S ribosomal protein L47, mitochondrial [Ornithorhynchus anatinus]|uniref:Large ribosomal subunit protein uL29m n=1 Tax=Ornithorhynchus anatinus TaxID=9258 RepID=F6SVN2_ORNAN|nr:39S ribosomal protein L47, mitochondrial [Ornithorhynchus anatinus]
MAAWLCRRLALCRPPVEPRSLGFALGQFYKSTSQVAPVHHCRFLHVSSSMKGLEEFFDDPKNWGAETVKSGAAWTCEQIRTKSNEDLHKLWYVLLKERNMLLTLEQEAKRQVLPMPSPERLEKVIESMDAIDTVVQERDRALRLLQTGQEYPRPGAWRRNILGQVIWHKFKQWAIPWYVNRRYKRKRFYAMPYTEPLQRLILEKHLAAAARKKNREEKREKLLERKFPSYAAKKAKLKAELENAPELQRSKS